MADKLMLEVPGKEPEKANVKKIVDFVESAPEGAEYVVRKNGDPMDAEAIGKLVSEYREKHPKKEPKPPKPVKEAVVIPNLRETGEALKTGKAVVTPIQIPDGAEKMNIPAGEMREIKIKPVVGADGKNTYLVIAEWPSTGYTARDFSVVKCTTPEEAVNAAGVPAGASVEVWQLANHFVYKNA